MAETWPTAPSGWRNQAAARVALGDAEARAGLQQRLADIAADEAAAAENGDEGRGAGVRHGPSILGAVEIGAVLGPSRICPQGSAAAG